MSVVLCSSFIKNEKLIICFNNSSPMRLMNKSSEILLQARNKFESRILFYWKLPNHKVTWSNICQLCSVVTCCMKTPVWSINYHISWLVIFIQRKICLVPATKPSRWGSETTRRLLRKNSEYLWRNRNLLSSRTCPSFYWVSTLLSYTLQIKLSNMTLFKIHKDGLGKTVLILQLGRDIAILGLACVTWQPQIGWKNVAFFTDLKFKSKRRRVKM
jgi:hypothetical protein